MGGVIIFLAVSVPFLILTDYEWRSVGVFGAAIACALLGFADDYTKLVKRRSLGLRARTKLIVTIAISLGLWWVATQEAASAARRCGCASSTTTSISARFYPLLIYLVVAGTTSAVNLTDGLDGLAAGCAAIVLLAYIGITFLAGDFDLAMLAGCLVGRVHRLPVVQRLPGDDLHGRHRLAGTGRGDRGAGGDDEDRGAADPAGRDLRDRGAVGGDPGDLLPDDPPAGVPDGADPPPLRAEGLVGDEDHPALLDRRVDLRARSASRSIARAGAFEATAPEHGRASRAAGFQRRASKWSGCQPPQQGPAGPRRPPPRRPRADGGSGRRPRAGASRSSSASC